MAARTTFITNKSWAYWERHCKGKIKHTEESAERNRKAMEKSYGTEFSKYVCNFCHKWHVGHKKEQP